MNFKNLSKAWIVAEIGVNHEGNPEVARDLIKLAAETGANAVKFQTYSAHQYVSSVQPERLERVKKFELSREVFRELSRYAATCGVTFFSTPLHADDADFLDEIVPLYKISSGDLTHLSLIAHVAQKGKPIIISTGLGTEAEIKDAVDCVLAVRPHAGRDGELMLMHCVGAYPTPPTEANLANISWLRERFDLPVGYSDHTLGIKACELAVTLGAVALEKHFTYRKENQAFHDHAISADPADMRALVENVRAAEQYLGSRIRQRQPSEEKMLKHLRRSVAAAADIPENTPIRKEWLTGLRPDWGIPVNQSETVVGKVSKRRIRQGDLVTPQDLM